jgi:perosamine synthetase
LDISLDTYTIDTEKLDDCIKKYKEKVKAILPIHLYGYPCNMDELMEIAEEYSINVLEDACQSHGATYKNKKVGSFGNAGAFSFYPSKNMTVCGDGGMVTTSNSDIAEKVSSLRDVGRSRDASYFHPYVGYTARMNTVNAAIGNLQLKYLEEGNDKRRNLARIYAEELAGVGDIAIPPRETTAIKPAWHLYVIRTKHRDLLKNYLEKKGIECGIHYPVPVHLQPPYRKMGYTEGMFPNTEKWAKEVLSLPLFPNMSLRGNIILFSTKIKLNL